MANIPGQTIYKIAERSEWDAASRVGSYAGSADDHRDGFIHFSTRLQLVETARKHFRGRSCLILISIASGALGDALKWEVSRGGDLFPHLYGALDVKHAIGIRELQLDDDGVPDVAQALELDGEV